MSNIERRNAPRISVNIPVQLSSRGDAEPATLTNLSTSGLACRFEAAISEMTLVGIDLDLPGVTQTAHVQGVVVRCDKLRGVHPPTYEIGIFFTAMTDATRASLAGFVEAQLASTEQ